MAYTIDLGGLRAMVTGSGRGVGRAIALSLAEAGASVVVNDYDADRATAVAAEITGAGGIASAVAFDVTDYEAVTAAVERAGPIDILVNNAGNAGVDGFTFPLFVETAPADWSRYVDVNLYGVMHCTRAVLPGMIEHQGGRVVTIISDAARWGEPRMAAYAAAKAGAAGFSRAVAREVGRHGITVNTVALGSIDAAGSDEKSGDEGTEPTQDDGAAARRERMLRAYILRRQGRPADVAGLVTFLVSPAASWITGQTYPVNGGYTVNQ